MHSDTTDSAAAPTHSEESGVNNRISNFLEGVSRADHWSNAVTPQMYKDGTINLPVFEGRTPLGRAILEKDQTLVAKFLEHGADPNGIDLLGETPLSLTLREPPQHQISSVLLHAGAEINRTDVSGRTVLMTAAYLGQLRQLVFLKANGADINLRDHAGKSLQDYAHAPHPNKKRGKTEKLVKDWFEKSPRHHPELHFTAPSSDPFFIQAARLKKRVEGLSLAKLFNRNEAQKTLHREMLTHVWTVLAVVGVVLFVPLFIFFFVMELFLDRSVVDNVFGLVFSGWLPLAIILVLVPLIWPFLCWHLTRDHLLPRRIQMQSPAQSARNELAKDLGLKTTKFSATALTPNELQDTNVHAIAGAISSGSHAALEMENERATELANSTDVKASNNLATRRHVVTLLEVLKTLPILIAPPMYLYIYFFLAENDPFRVFRRIRRVAPDWSLDRAFFLGWIPEPILNGATQLDQISSLILVGLMVVALAANYALWNRLELGLITSAHKNVAAQLLMRRRKIAVRYQKQFSAAKASSPSEISPHNKSYAVYLRSFDIDQRIKLGEDDLESLLAGAISFHMDLIAISDRIQDAGAAKLRFEDHTWQQGVSSMVEGASLIFMVPNPSTGTLWELKLLEQADLMGKTVFIMPPIWPQTFDDKLDLAKRWEQLRQDPQLRHWELPPYNPNGCVFRLTSKGSLLSWNALHVTRMHVEHAILTASPPNQGSGPDGNTEHSDPSLPDDAFSDSSFSLEDNSPTSFDTAEAGNSTDGGSWFGDGGGPDGGGGGGG